MGQPKNSEKASAIIAECLRRADAGRPVDPQRVLAKYPECAEELQAYFAGEQMLGDALRKRTHSGKKFGHPVSQDETVAPGAADSVPAAGATFDHLPTEFGRYRVLKVLGQGAMGAVYLAHDTELGRDVALKTPKLDGSGDSQLAQRFSTEARSAAVLHHRNICPVYDVGEINGVSFMTMAYIDGACLTSVVSEDRPLPGKQAALVVRKLALGLQEAHANGVIHRDLKPANVMIDSSREPVVMDFGLARQLESTAQSRLTNVGTVMGSPAYMSPEQVSGELDAVGPSADIYSLGVILFELLSGRLPYEGSVVAILGQIVGAEPPDVRDRQSDVDSGLAEICNRMIAKNPDDRFATMQDVADALTHWLKKKQRKTSRPAGEDRSTEEIALSLSDEFAAIDEPLPLPTARRRTQSKEKRTSNRKKLIAGGVAGGLGLLLLAAVVIRFRDGSAVEIPNGNHTVEITTDSNGSVDSVTITPLAPETKNSLPLANAQPAVLSSSIGPKEVLTSDEWEWAEPQFIGEFETASGMDTLLTDDFVTWMGATHEESYIDPKSPHDIVMFTRQSGDSRWSSPVNIGPPVNGSGDERGPSLSADGRTLVFQSNRPGGLGGRDDLWVSERTSVGASWSEPVNFGPQVNSRRWEGQASFSYDGLTIYFSSDRKKGFGKSDLWKTTRSAIGKPWSAAVNLGPQVNSAAGEMNPTVSADGLVLIFNEDGRPNGLGAFDLWMCQRDSLHDSWSSPVNLGPSGQYSRP